MKSLKPTQRESKRYLLVKGQNLRENVEKSIKDFIGALGKSKASLAWIKKEADTAVISVNREVLNHVRASFAIWPEEIKVLRVSGTLKGLEKK